MSDLAHLRGLPLVGLPRCDAAEAAAVDAGETVGPAAWDAVWAARGLTRPGPCGMAPESVEEGVGTDTLARLALDVAPASGAEAPSWVLGPWADLSDADVAGLGDARRAAVAMAAFVLSDEVARTPVRSWLRDEPRPAASERLVVLATQRTPPLRWRWVSGPIGAARVEPVGAVVPWWVPSVPVDLSGAGWLVSAPTPGDVVFARLVPGSVRWIAAAAVWLPDGPEVWDAEERLMLPITEAWPGLRREDVLRLTGHHVAALATRAAWRRVGGVCAPLPSAALQAQRRMA